MQEKTTFCIFSLLKILLKIIMKYCNICFLYRFFFFIEKERATGYGVCLLNTLFGAMSSNIMLQTLAPDVNQHNNANG